MVGEDSDAIVVGSLEFTLALFEGRSESSGTTPLLWSTSDRFERV